MILRSNLSSSLGQPYFLDQGVQRKERVGTTVIREKRGTSFRPLSGKVSLTQKRVPLRVVEFLWLPIKREVQTTYVSNYLTISLFPFTSLGEHLFNNRLEACLCTCYGLKSPSGIVTLRNSSSIHEQILRNTFRLNL